ncbi:sugar ABC transporter permease [Nocardioides sp. InS609-2]|uniref:carbohydrate ABC transporter permease n=1 Tax=Nocardioides sp. InS609-2 TaxID=2760705 RepID=UPI0020BD5FC0|nr:sugar ABC transporter permease [Nocardioides sp. InS609-2]
MSTTITTARVSESVSGSTRADSDPGAFARGKRRIFAPFVVPSLVLYVAFLVLPTIATVVLSFTSWSGAGDTPKPNGVANYTELASSFPDGAFARSFVNTLIYIVVGGVGTFVLAFLFAMVLRDMRANKFIRAILFFPNIVAPLALGMYFGFVFRSPDGLANNMLGMFGIDYFKFLSSDNVTYIAMAGIVWSSAGFYITIIMAAIDRVPTYLYEDAAIAGATAWQKFRSITLPLTWDVVGIAGVLWTISAVKIFELVWVLAGPGTYSPPVKTWTLGVMVFDRTFGGRGTPQYGVACAVAVVMILLVSLFVLLLRRFMRRETVQF